MWPLTLLTTLSVGTFTTPVSLGFLLPFSSFFIQMLDLNSSEECMHVLCSHSIFHFFIVVLGGGTLWHLQKFFQYIKYIILELTPSTIMHSWDYRFMPLWPAYLWRWVTNFLPRLVLKHDPLNLCLLTKWDYRRHSSCLTSFTSRAHSLSLLPKMPL
jgi:hypothetical protein